MPPSSSSSIMASATVAAEVQKVFKRLGQDEQGGVALLGVAFGQGFEFAVQLVGDLFASILRLADDVVDLTLDVHALGEGAQVQADDGAPSQRSTVSAMAKILG